MWFPKKLLKHHFHYNKLLQNVFPKSILQNSGHEPHQALTELQSELWDETYVQFFGHIPSACLLTKDDCRHGKAPDTTVCNVVEDPVMLWGRFVAGASGAHVKTEGITKYLDISGQ